MDVTENDSMTTNFQLEVEIMSLLCMHDEKWLKMTVNAFRLSKFLSLIGNLGR